jgi:hypothetical protein
MKNEFINPIYIFLGLVILIIDFSLKYNDIQSYLKSGVIILKTKLKMTKNLIIPILPTLEREYKKISFQKINDYEVLFRDKFFYLGPYNELFIYPRFVIGGLSWDESTKLLIIYFRLPWTYFLYAIIFLAVILSLPVGMEIKFGLLFFIFIFQIVDFHIGKRLKNEITNYIERRISDFTDTKN